MANFDPAFEHVLLAEGGATYTNNPKDKGGPTKYGITLGALSSWRGKPCTADDVKNLQEAEAKTIYKKQYWDKLGLDAVDSQMVALILFDQGVNRGVGAVSKMRDAILAGRKINNVQEHQFGIAFFKESQLAYVEICKRNPSQLVFLKGWLNRTYKLLELVV